MLRLTLTPEQQAEAERIVAGFATTSSVVRGYAYAYWTNDISSTFDHHDSGLLDVRPGSGNPLMPTSREISSLD